MEGWYQGFYQYQPFCWNFIKVFHTCTYHKLGHSQGKRSLDKRRDFIVYVLKINTQEWRHAWGILEYANTTIQWNPRYNEKGVYLYRYLCTLYILFKILSCTLPWIEFFHIPICIIQMWPKRVNCSCRNCFLWQAIPQIHNTKWKWM